VSNRHQAHTSAHPLLILALPRLLLCTLASAAIRPHEACSAPFAVLVCSWGPPPPHVTCDMLLQMDVLDSDTRILPRTELYRTETISCVASVRGQCEVRSRAVGEVSPRGQTSGSLIVDRIIVAIEAVGIKRAGSGGAVHALVVGGTEALRHRLCVTLEALLPRLLSGFRAHCRARRART
jgi:hypothetical protein